jgi:hypothetical protein
MSLRSIRATLLRPLTLEDEIPIRAAAANPRRHCSFWFKVE